MRHDHADNLTASFSVRWLFSTVLAIVLGLTGCSDPITEAANDAFLAQELLQQRRIGEARIAIRRAIDANDSNSEYYIISGRIEFAAGKTENAFAAYDNALSLDRTNLEALEAVSQLGLQTGALRKSLKATETILALYPSNANAILVAGLHAIARKRFAEADEFADRLLEIDPENEGGIILKTRAAFLRGETQSALQILRSYAETKEPTSGIALTQLELHRESGNSEEMARQFESLRELMPENYALRIDEANLRFKLGEREAGIQLSAGPLLDPQVGTDVVRGAISLWREYDVKSLPTRFIEELAQAGSPQTRRLVGEYLASTGAIDSVTTVSGGLAKAKQMALLADAYLRAGNRRAAARHARIALSADSQECIAKAVRAQLTVRTNSRMALRDAQEAANECPERIDAWMAAARAYDLMDDDFNARRTWRQGIDANPQNSVLARAYSDWLLEHESSREALAVGRRLTANSPALVSAWKLYDDICRAAPDATCESRAESGLRRAERRYAIDLLPGEIPPNGLFGRLDRS